MRLMGIVLAIVCASGTAFAQTAPKPASKPAPPGAAAKPAAPKPTLAKPTPAKPAPAKPAPAAAARAGYAAMTAAERMAIQSDLIWTGDYNGLITVDLGDRAIAAVKAFQKRYGGRDTGVLSVAERQTLAQEAKPKQEAAGWRLVDDTATGVWLGLPTRLVPRTATVGTGSRWQSARGEIQIDTFRITGSGTTLASVFDKLKKEPATRKVEYSVLRGDAAVLSGLQGLKKFYVRVQFKDNEVRGVTILYDQALEGTMDPVTVAMSNAFVPFPDGTITGLLPPGPPPKRKVDYGSGVVVTTTGHILTDRQVTEACRSITVASPAATLGHAEVVATDKAGDLALIRIFGVSDWTPVSLGDGLPSSATLIGIADPQLQGGGRAVTAVTAQLAAAAGARTVEPTPALGFSGAAALDADARLVGLVGFRQADMTVPARAAMVPAAAIKAFLSANAVAPPAGRTGLDDAKAAIVQVICVRR
jgi:peptidoglycan hydrolase-like protein with peptidoglycan-binding domain